MSKVIIVLNYIIRILLIYVYVPHGYEKLTQKISVQEYIDYGLQGDFLDFYLIWERTGFIYVIGVAQLLGGLLLIFKRTYLLGSVFLLPISIGMLFCHVFISHAMDFLYFDLIVLVLNMWLIAVNYKALLTTFFNPQKSWI